ncbi:unnamed protein product [Meganyctiphanes norvegica]|uniref:PPPDE domain-containing protein n=1 Tax=Meganyctiphanes norvegica TaxID=48144 RepID=A0AAV2QN04_MEGNR
MSYYQASRSLDIGTSNLTTNSWTLLQNWCKESERTKGVCEVSLWTRPVDSEASEVKKDTKSIKKDKLNQNLRLMITHWALVFEWKEHTQAEDGDRIFPRSVTYEALALGDLLVPTWKENAPKENDWKKANIGQIELSPKDINQAAKNLSFNGLPYDIVNMNCQKWVKELLKILMGNTLNIPDLSFLPFIEVIRPFLG